MITSNSTSSRGTNATRDQTQIQQELMPTCCVPGVGKENDALEHEKKTASMTKRHACTKLLEEIRSDDEPMPPWCVPDPYEESENCDDYDRVTIKASNVHRNKSIEEIDDNDAPPAPFQVPSLIEERKKMRAKLDPSQVENGVQGGTIEFISFGSQMNGERPPNIPTTQECTSPNRSSSFSPPSFPSIPQQFDFEVEATLVPESIEDGILSSVPTYDAVPLSERKWKMRLAVLTVVVILLTITLGVSIAKGKPINPGQKEDSNFQNDSCGRYVGPMLGINHVNGSGPIPAIHGDTAGVSKDMEFLQFFSITNGKFKKTTKIIIDYIVFSFSISADVAAVGAPMENDNTGVVFVYERTSTGNWEYSSLIYLDDTTGNESWFGYEVIVDGNVVVVAATLSVYIYRRSEMTWMLEAKIDNDQNSTPSLFVNSLSIAGDKLAIGVLNEVKVYRFVAMQKYWEQVGNPVVVNECDSSLALRVALTKDGGLLVGCKLEDDENTGEYYRNEQGPGAAFYYTGQGTGGNYEFRQKMFASDGNEADELGGKYKIATNGNRMVVGTMKEANDRAYIFTKTDNGRWVKAAKLDKPDSSGGYFGITPVIGPNYTLIGSNNDIHVYSLEFC